MFFRNCSVDSRITIFLSGLLGRMSRVVIAPAPHVCTLTETKMSTILPSAGLGRSQFKVLATKSLVTIAKIWDLNSRIFTATEKTVFARQSIDSRSSHRIGIE